MTGQHAADAGQIRRADPNGTGPEIAVQQLLHIAADQAVGLQQIGQSPVFGAGGLFGVIDLLVQGDLIIVRQAADEVQQTLEPMVIRLAPRSAGTSEWPRR